MSKINKNQLKGKQSKTKDLIVTKQKVRELSEEELEIIAGGTFMDSQNQ